MCGLIGLIYKGQNGMFANHFKAFYEGIYVDSLRGEDATGVCLIDKDGSAEVLKQATDAFYFLQSKEWYALQVPAIKSGKAILGHNRKATVGGLVDENAHPFIIDNNFVFFHNGSLLNWKQLGYNTEVDSESLGIHVQKAIRNGTSISKPLADIYGAYACVWYDLETAKVQMVRNTERPLYLIECDSCYIYCSELEMGMLVAKRNSITVKGSEAIPPATLITFDLTAPYDKCKPIVTPLTIEKPVYKPTTTPTSTGGWVSKNAYKRFRKEMVGECISFWVDKYTKSDTTPTMFRIEGSYDDETISDSISIFGYLTTDEETVYQDYYGAFVNATVADLFYKEHNGSVEIVVRNIQPAGTANLHCV